jgi:hypothetical protein
VPRGTRRRFQCQNVGLVERRAPSDVSFFPA